MKLVNFKTGIVFLWLGLISSAAISKSQFADTQVISSSPGYELKQITVVDDNGVTRTQELYYIHSREGANNAYLHGGLPFEEKEALIQEMDSWGGDWRPGAVQADEGAKSADSDDSFTWVIDRRAVLLDTEDNAQAYIDEYDMQQVIDDEIAHPDGDRATSLKDMLLNAGPVERRGLFKRCRGWRQNDKSFNKSINENFNHDKRFGKDNAYIDFIGNLKIQGSIDLNVRYEYQRRFCIPYKFRFVRAITKADYDARGDFSLVGKAQHNFGNFSWEIAKPKIMDSLFFVGPIPVRVAAKLPIEVGTGEIKVSATGEVKLEKPLHFKGNFQYTCYTNACSKDYANHQNLSGNLKNALGASISASVTLSPYVQVAVRPFLYGEWFFYAQVGVKPSFPIELFGYYGNLCGDGDNNGSQETVVAALGTLAFEVGVTAEAKVFNIYVLKPKYWKIWHKPLLMFDFLAPAGSSAFSPILRPDIANNSMQLSLPVSIRSCVARFASQFPVDYSIDWGDGQSVNLSDVASTKTLSHTYASGGDYTVTVSYKNNVNTKILVSVNDDWGGDW